MQETRLQRVNSEIKKALSQILSEEIRDPRLHEGLISITSVDTTNDLSHCTIYVSIYNSKERVIYIFHTLQHSAGFIRKLLSKKVDLRITPELHFKLDEGYENSEKMCKLIDSLNIPAEENSEN